MLSAPMASHTGSSLLPTLHIPLDKSKYGVWDTMNPKGRMRGQTLGLETASLSHSYIVTKRLLTSGKEPHQ